MNWVQIDDVYEAWCGNLEPLAKSIERGQALTEEAAEFLAMYLRDEVKWPRGNKRTFAQIKRDSEVAHSVSYNVGFEGLTVEAAIYRHCDENGVNYETVRSALRRIRDFDGVLHPQATVRCPSQYVSFL